MHLADLPAVLVQTLMHALKPKEILTFARCSGWTLQCADSAFAWRDCPAFRLESFDEHSNVPLAGSRLSRWIPLSVSLRCLSEAGAGRLLALMQSCPRILRLGWYEWKLPVERGLELLSHPSMQHLRAIGPAPSLCADWLTAIAVLPCLVKLDLTSAALETSALLPLIHARALRKLSVSEAEGERLSVVMQLTQLTTLHIYAPQLNGTNFLAFCTAMSGLDELSLERWSVDNVRSISSVDLAAGFTALRSLRALKFIMTFDEVTLAPVLLLAPSLRLLTLPYFLRDHDFIHLAQLSVAAPMLDIQLASWDQEAFDRTVKSLQLSC